MSRCPSFSAFTTVFELQGQGGHCALNHCSTSRRPPVAAAAVVHSSHGHGGSCSRAHFSSSRWPPSAAFMLVCLFQGQPFSRAHMSTGGARGRVSICDFWYFLGRIEANCVFEAGGSPSRCPPAAAAAQHAASQRQPFSRAQRSRGQPFSRNHMSTSRLPPAAAAALVKWSQRQPFSLALGFRI
jgi:hypothetical protein